MSKIMPIVKDIIDYPTMIIFVLAGIYTFVSDHYNYNKKGFTRETKIIKGIMYSYITIGGLMYVFLLIV